MVSRAHRRAGRPYAVQAAIAAVHDEAAASPRTDWPQIVALYDVLSALDPSPVIALNRAAAIAMRDGPEAGLALLDGWPPSPGSATTTRTPSPGPTSCTGSDVCLRQGRRTGGRSSWPGRSPSGPSS